MKQMPEVIVFEYMLKATRALLSSVGLISASNTTPALSPTSATHHCTFRPSAEHAWSCQTGTLATSKHMKYTYIV